MFEELGVIELTQNQALALGDIKEKLYPLNSYMRAVLIADAMYIPSNQDSRLTGDEIKAALLELHRKTKPNGEALIMKYLLGEASVGIKDYDTFILSEKEPKPSENEDYKNIYIEMKKKEESQKTVGFVSTKQDVCGKYTDLKKITFLVLDVKNSTKDLRIKKELIVQNVKSYTVQPMGEQSMLHMVTSDGRDISIKLSLYDGYKVEDMKNDEE